MRDGGMPFPASLSLLSVTGAGNENVGQSTAGSRKKRCVATKFCHREVTSYVLWVKGQMCAEIKK